MTAAVGDLAREVAELRAELSRRTQECDRTAFRAETAERSWHSAEAELAATQTEVEGLRVAEAEAMLVLESVEARLGAELVRTADLRTEVRRLRETVWALAMLAQLPWAHAAGVVLTAGQRSILLGSESEAERICDAANRAMEV